MEGIRQEKRAPAVQDRKKDMKKAPRQVLFSTK
jgi:hypothetical protein